MDWAFIIIGGLHLLREMLAKLRQIDRPWFEFHFAGFGASNQQYVFHHFGHLTSCQDDMIELFAALLRFEALKIAVEIFGGGENDAERSAEFMGDHRNKARAQIA